MPNGPSNPLCPGAASKSALKSIDRNGRCPSDWAASNEKPRAVLAARFADLGGRLNGAGDVRRVRHRHQSSFGLQRPANIVGIDQSAGIATDASHLDSAVLFQIAQRPQHGIVVGIGADGVIARAQQAVNGQIQRIGAVVRKDNLPAQSLAPMRRATPARAAAICRSASVACE